MVKKAASEGPSLFCEWAVGSTIDSAVRKVQKERLEKENEEARRKRDVIKVELTTNDGSGTDSVRVTYPRKGANGGAKGATKKPPGTKQVRFNNEPLKPALKKKMKSKRRDASSGSDTLVTESESGTDSGSVDATTSGTSNSEADSTDTSSFRRQKSRKSRRPKDAISEDSDAIFDSGRSDCERELAKQKAKERKSRSKYASDGESTGYKKGCRGKKDEKHGNSKKRRAGRRSGSHKDDDPIDVDSDPDISEDEGKSQRRKESPKHKTKDTSPKNKVRPSSRDQKSTLSSKQKDYPEAMPGPHPRRPNLIRPIRAEVMQVEHTVEGPEDPRPNAFVDERNNIVRVYHGPAYGNPFGKLYPRRDPSQRPLPVGVPHPLDNPYYHGFMNSRQWDHQKSPTGQMPTTLGVNYSSIPATAGPSPQGQTNDLTSGLWGLEDNPKNKPPSWTNNIGPPTPSASLRKANPASRWGFAGSDKRGTRAFSGGSKKSRDWNANDDWGKTGNSGWSDAGENGTGGAWDAGGGGNGSGNWNSNDNTAANDGWGNEGNAWDNQSPQKSPDGQAGNDSWANAGNDNTWGDQNAGNDSWTNGGNVTTWGAKNTTWDAGAQDGSSQSASNNVGFVPGTGAGSPPGDGSHNDNVGGQGWPSGQNHVPGAWDAGERYADWRDPTAAQSTWV